MSTQALELGKDKGTGMRWPLVPTFSDGKAGPTQVQSADASRTLRSSLAGSFNDGDGVRCACQSLQPADQCAQRRTALCRSLTMRRPPAFAWAQSHPVRLQQIRHLLRPA